MAGRQEISERERAFDRLALAHVDALYNAALRMTGNVPDAEDLVQDTYLKAYRFFYRFRQDSNMAAWLFKIMKNTYINRFRVKARQPVMVSPSPLQDGERPFEPRDTANTPEDEVFGPLLEDEVEHAVRSLPDEFKWVVLLSDVEGLPYREIADIVGCPVGTVRSRLSRGRQLLRKQLWGYAKENGYIHEEAVL